MRNAGTRILRHFIRGVAVAVALSGGPSYASQLDENVAFDIPAQPLESALFELSKQSAYQIVFSSGSLPKQNIRAISGKMQVKQALNLILSGTDLGYKLIGERTITVGPGKPGNLTSYGGADVDHGVQLARVDFDDQRKESSAPANQRPSAAADSRGAEDKAQVIQEIIVTAQKRAQRLQDVPIPVTAVGADTLVDSNQLLFQDYYTRIPGLNVAYDGTRGGLPSLAIRGIRSSYSENPTVAIVVDDLAYGSALQVGGGNWMPEIDPGDLARVEVLRGPQGTLYGASAMGGVLKFVTVDPSPDGFTGRVQAGMSSVSNGDEPGYNVRGVVNVPLSDMFAIRASGFTRSDPGYIDNPGNGIEGINRMDVSGGRLSALLRPSDRFSVRLSALLQDTDMAGSSHSQPTLGDLRQSALRDTGWVDRRFEVYDATIKASLGSAEITAVSGYTVNTMSDSIEFSAFFGPLAQTLFGVGGAAVDEDNRTRKLSQEVRLSVPFGRRLQWLFGAFYADEDSRLKQPRQAVDPATGTRVGYLGEASGVIGFEEYAGFTNLTYSFTDRFDLQVGGRLSEYRQNHTGITVNVAPGSTTRSELDVRVKENAFTYLVTPSFKLSPNVLMYARLASGYRAGGANLGVQDLVGVPSAYEPDETQNYEIGVKGTVLEGTLTFDASLYYIDWRDIQLSLVTQGRGYKETAGAAKSQGVELSIESRPLTGLTLAAWVAWNDAELTEDFPPPPTSSARGFEGDRLPFSSRLSGSLSVTQAFPITADMTGVVGGSVSYVDDRKGPFTGSLLRETFPSYTQVDLHAGLKYGSWTMDLFANNVADERGILAGGLGTVFPTAFSYIRPRTVGLAIGKSF